METTLLSRLEAAISRLEFIPTPRPTTSLPRTETTIDVPDDNDTIDPAIAAFDDLVTKSIGRLRVAAETIGDGVKEVTVIVEEAFTVEKELLLEAKKSKKPDLLELEEFMEPLSDAVTKATAMIQGRRPDYFNHLKAAADSLVALFWITYTGKDCGTSLPVSHVEESWQMAEFYNNKVIAEYRTRDPDHVEWARALKDLFLPGLRDLVKKFYPSGPHWSSTHDLPDTAGSFYSRKYRPSKNLPPLPAGSLFSATDATSTCSRTGMPSLKSSTIGMTSPTDDIKAKRQEEQSIVEGTSFCVEHRPPNVELQMGRKWVVEYQVGNKNLVLKDCDHRQSLYVFGCKDSVLRIKGKVNNITIDRCNMVGVVFMDVVASCEIINCCEVEVQCQGFAPSISVDNTVGCQLYLSRDSLGASITTSKSSEISVMVPVFGGATDWVKHDLPKWFSHAFNGGRFITTPELRRTV